MYRIQIQIYCEKQRKTFKKEAESGGTNWPTK